MKKIIAVALGIFLLASTALPAWATVDWVNPGDAGKTIDLSEVDIIDENDAKAYNDLIDGKITSEQYEQILKENKKKRANEPKQEENSYVVDGKNRDINKKNPVKHIVVMVDLQYVYFPDQQPYINEDNRSMVPLRFVAEKMGCEVDWNQETRTVTISKEGITIVLKVSENKALVNEQEKTFDTKAEITNGRTMIPLRFISECLGAEVDWKSESTTVFIYTH